jgi:hypothetical protein
MQDCTWEYGIRWRCSNFHRPLLCKSYNHCSLLRCLSTGPFLSCTIVDSSTSKGYFIDECRLTSRQRSWFDPYSQLCRWHQEKGALLLFWTRPTSRICRLEVPKCQNTSCKSQGFLFGISSPGACSCSQSPRLKRSRSHYLLPSSVLAQPEEPVRFEGVWVFKITRIMVMHAQRSSYELAGL